LILVEINEKARGIRTLGQKIRCESQIHFAFYASSFTSERVIGEVELSSFQMELRTPAGRFFLIATENGIRRASWESLEKIPVMSLADVSCERAKHHLSQASQQIFEYFSGARKQFDLTLDIDGTDFQKRVWKELQRIPFGRTESYTEVASRVGRPKAIRAVGSANRKNPVNLLVPCHRVIGKDGRLAGYAGGVNIKHCLLELERLCRL